MAGCLAPERGGGEESTRRNIERRGFLKNLVQVFLLMIREYDVHFFGEKYIYDFYFSDSTSAFLAQFY